MLVTSFVNGAAAPSFAKNKTLLESDIPTRLMKVAEKGLEEEVKTNWKPSKSELAGAESSSVGARPPDTDSDLQTVIQNWPALSPAFRAGILVMVNASENA